MSLKRSLCFAAIVFVITLIYEPTFFYAPYFVFAVFLREHSLRASFKQAWHIPAASALVVLLFMFAGSTADPAICQRLDDVGIGQPCNNSYGMIWFSAFPQTFFGTMVTTWHRVVANLSVLTPHNLCMLLVVLLLPMYGCICVHSRFFKAQPWPLVCAHVALLLVSLPLFLLGFDWGRFFGIHTVLVFISYLLLLQDQRHVNPLC